MEAGIDTKCESGDEDFGSVRGLGWRVIGQQAELILLDYLQRLRGCRVKAAAALLCLVDSAPTAAAPGMTHYYWAGNPTKM